MTTTLRSGKDGGASQLTRPAGSAARTPGGRRRLDAVGMLTIFLVLQFVIPSTLVFKTLGANGTPANVFGIGLFVWWLCSRLLPGLGGARGYQPVRIAFGLFATALIVSYLASFTRSITAEEIRAGDRSIITLAAWAGILLITVDGIDSRARLEVLVRRIATAGTWLGCLAVAQFASHRELIDNIRLPGLSDSGTTYLFRQYGGSLSRVVGTAAHPIELGVVLAMTLPMALHVAVHATRRVIWRWLAVAIICSAVFMSFSRSGMLGVILVAVMLIPTWPPQWRWKAIVAIPMFLGAMRLLVKGLVGTMISLFLTLGQDDSIQGRAQRRAEAFKYVHLAPWFGRGIGTFITKMYVLLDNSYLGLLIETGIFGLTAMIILFLTGTFTARGARRRALDFPARHLGQCVAASILVMALAFATYDGIAYAMGTSTLFLMLGLSGALWRIVREEQAAAGPELRFESAALVPGRHVRPF